MTSPGPIPPAPRRSDRPGLLRSLGQFFGHIVHGVKSDPGRGPASPANTPEPAQSVVVKHEIDEKTVPTAAGTVRLRRTVIEEVELDPEQPRPDPGAEGQGR